MIGFLGAYTTFSTLMLESWRLIEDGAVPPALPTWLARASSGWSRFVAGLTLGKGHLHDDRPAMGCCVRIYIGESDQWHGKPLYQAIVGAPA